VTTPAIPAEEREINLLLALRNTAEGLTAAEIIKRVSGYNPAGGGRALFWPFAIPLFCFSQLFWPFVVSMWRKS